MIIARLINEIEKTLLSVFQQLQVARPVALPVVFVFIFNFIQYSIVLWPNSHTLHFYDRELSSFVSLLNWLPYVQILRLNIVQFLHIKNTVRFSS
jgi:hypothetical protein